MVLKDIEDGGAHLTKEGREYSKKYKEGLKKLLSVVSKTPLHDVKIRYIRTIEIKMKLCWANL